MLISFLAHVFPIHTESLRFQCKGLLSCLPYLFGYVWKGNDIIICAVHKRVESWNKPMHNNKFSFWGIHMPAPETCPFYAMIEEMAATGLHIAFTNCIWQRAERMPRSHALCRSNEFEIVLKFCKINISQRNVKVTKAFSCSCQFQCMSPNAHTELFIVLLQTWYV